MSNEVPVEEVASTSETEEPNITTNVEEVSDEESVVSSDEEVAKPEVAKHDVADEEVAEEPAQEVASETVKPDVTEPEVVEPEVVEPEVVEPEVVEPNEVKSSDNDLENRVKELEERLNHLLNILPIWANGCANFPTSPHDLINLL